MNSSCELCASEENLIEYDVVPSNASITVCQTCHEQINTQDTLNVNHWHCLNESMWSDKHEVQIMAYRLLQRLSSEGWAQDLLEQLYLEDDVLTIAQAVSSDDENMDQVPTKDSNGTTLEAGDSVTIIKDLDVKGAGFTAKRGTVVKNISLTNNPEQIEGRVNGTKIVLLSKFLKKS